MLQKMSGPPGTWNTERADLKSLGLILVYLGSANLQWVDFKATAQGQRIPENIELPELITTYFDCVEATNSPDYSTLRKVLKGLSPQLNLCLLEKACFAGADQPLHHPGILYENIHIQLVKIGAETCRPIDRTQGLRLLSHSPKYLTCTLSYY